MERKKQNDADFTGESEQLAMVYSPVQSWQGLYSPDEALARGTMFRALDKPLEEGDCYEEG